MNTKWLKWAVKRYLPDIFAGAACAGVVLTGYLGAKSGIKAYQQIVEQDDPLTKKEELKLTWKCYISPAIMALTTCGCVIGAHKAHLHKESILTAAAGAWAVKYVDLEKHAKELLGEDRYNELKKMIGLPKSTEALPPAEEGKEWYYEPYSRQYFEATEKDILYAQLYINKTFQEYGGVTLNDLLNVLPNCCRIDIGSDIGWYQGTDVWEDIWTSWNPAGGFSHFINIDLRPLKNQPDIKMLDYEIYPSIPDEDWEPWK